MLMLNEKREFKGVISIILVFAMLTATYFSPITGGVRTAFAEDAPAGELIQPAVEGEESNSSNSSQDNQPVTLESLVDKEGFLTDEGLLSLKKLPYDEEKYKEIVDNKDGAKTVNLYTDPIKYENEEGEYEYIDSSLVEKSPESISETLYETVASDVEIQISDNLNQSNAVQISFEDYTIGFKPLNILTENGKSKADVGFIETETEIIKENIESAEECEAVVYSETFEDNTDIVMMISGG